MSQHRPTITITDQMLRVGPSVTAIPGDDPASVLSAYLKLIRRVRNQERHRSLALRRVDIVALAEHLDWTDEQVLARLADLMGATRRQRATMLAVLATGATVITIANPQLAVAGGTDAAPVGTPTVITFDVARARELPRTSPVLEAVRDRASEPSARAQFRLEPVGTPAPTATPSSTRPTPTTATESVPPATTPPSVGTSTPATDAGGNLVAVGQPPVPPSTPTVAVGEPPVPPAVDADGNFVAVGEPPVPPPTEG